MQYFFLHHYFRIHVNVLFMTRHITKKVMLKEILLSSEKETDVKEILLQVPMGMPEQCLNSSHIFVGIKGNHGKKERWEEGQEGRKEGEERREEVQGTSDDCKRSNTGISVSLLEKIELFFYSENTLF